MLIILKNQIFSSEGEVSKMKKRLALPASGHSIHSNHCCDYTYLPVVVLVFCKLPPKLKEIRIESLSPLQPLTLGVSASLMCSVCQLLVVDSRFFSHTCGNNVTSDAVTIFNVVV